MGREGYFLESTERYKNSSQQIPLHMVKQFYLWHQNILVKKFLFMFLQWVIAAICWIWKLQSLFSYNSFASRIWTTTPVLILWMIGDMSIQSIDSETPEFTQTLHDLKYLLPLRIQKPISSPNFGRWQCLLSPPTVAGFKGYHDAKDRTSPPTVRFGTNNNQGGLIMSCTWPLRLLGWSWFQDTQYHLKIPTLPPIQILWLFIGYLFHTLSTFTSPISASGHVLWPEDYLTVLISTSTHLVRNIITGYSRQSNWMLFLSSPFARITTSRVISAYSVPFLLKCSLPLYTEESLSICFQVSTVFKSI
jgi:hypothetical protein